MSSVDVVVPCYRYGHFLEECVQSVLAQDPVDVRVLIIDDASPDQTAQVATLLAQQDSRVVFLQHNVNKGHIRTYNEGIDWASSDYFLLLSADDYLLPGALSRATAFMDDDSSVGFTFGGVNELNDGVISEDTHNVDYFLRGKDERTLKGMDFIKKSGARNLVPTATAVVRTSLQKKVGGYRPQLPHAGDMEMWFRLALHAKVGVLRGPQAIYRRHSANMSLTYMKQRWVPDLQQRRAAIDCFIQYCDHRFPDTGRLHAGLLAAVSREALGLASSAFNDGDMALCSTLTQFALTISPRATRSMAWAKLAVKRALGVHIWCSILPVLHLVRQVMRNTRDR